MIASRNGDFVEWDDYAALAADYVEVKNLYLKCRIDIGNLHKENERLRKAGDAMAESINFDDQRSWEDWGNQGKSLLRDCVIDWIIAKRGGTK